MIAELMEIKIIAGSIFEDLSILIMQRTPVFLLIEIIDSYWSLAKDL
ncbi:MAG: hypothetical protein ACI9N9_001219 [Enterobacterales bacterium]|jgi:hypothetical protein